MKATQAIKLTVEQRLRFEVTLARARVERAYKQMQDDLHSLGRYRDASMIEMHEAEQILIALERVSGAFYRESIANDKAYREEQRRHAKEESDATLAAMQKAPAP